MAVSVDTVYQKVLAFANKEQRGYITPQEFNLFADQAQMEIFEQYFYDSNQFKRVPGNDSVYHDMVDLIDNKVSAFKTTAPVTDGQFLNSFTPDLYRLGRIWCTDGNTATARCIVEETTHEQHVQAQVAPLTKTTNERPRYRIYQDAIRLNPAINPLGSYVCSYVKKPMRPNWNYVVVNDKPLYNSTTSTDFELHLSEESELVYRILAFVGIAIEKPQLTQAAIGLEGAKVQQEKAK